jgi:hypothetical protein
LLGVASLGVVGGLLILAGLPIRQRASPGPTGQEPTRDKPDALT